MKIFYATSSFIALTFFALFPFQNLQATNYSDNGTNNSYSLNNGDTLKILSGIYNGTLNVFSIGAVVVVNANATFKPNSIITAKGKIINYGQTKFVFALGTFEGFSIDNYGTINFQQDVSLYDGITATQVWNNYAGGVINVSGNLNMGAKTKLVNNGSINISQSLNMWGATAEIINNKYIDVTGSFNMSAGKLTNENRISTSAFNFWGGQLANEGVLDAEGAFTISATQTYVNNCRLITKGAITNYGTLQNNGLIWAGTTNTSADEFYNSGTYISAPGAKLRSVKLTNYNVIKGSGYLYFTGSTYSSGTVGVSGTTTDSLKVYDVSRSNALTIFDTQFGTVNPNTVYRTFSAPDSMEVFNGCSNIFKLENSPLPVKWNYFSVKMIQDQPMLSWSAEYEPNMKFEIERSYDRAHYEVIKTMYSNTTSAYTYSDALANKSYNFAYYRIKGTSAVDGAVKYTDIRAASFGKQNSSFSVYPNPTTDKVSINFNSDKTQQLLINIKNANGQTVMMKNVTANQGTNFFDLNEFRSYQKGVYFIDLISGNTILTTEKVVKQ